MMEQNTSSRHSCCRPIPNSAFSYSCGFNFDAEVMDGFLECVQRMVPSAADSSEISKELEVYRRAMGTFGFDMAINDRKNIIPSFTLFQNLISLLSLF